jgi:hypothetical protein
MKECKAAKNPDLLGLWFISTFMWTVEGYVIATYYACGPWTILMDNLMDGYAPSTRFPTGIAHRLPKVYTND